MPGIQIPGFCTKKEANMTKTDNQKERVNGMLPADLEPLMLSLGHPKYRASQILEWVYGKMAASYDEMTNIPEGLRDRLKEVAPLEGTRIIDIKRSSDNSRKLLLGFSDGQSAETVLMDHDYGLSLCVSSQAGCKMGCTFCASAIAGFGRDLKASEMCDQFLAASRQTGGKRISSVVIMGMGEPLMNYDETMKFIRILNWDKGFNIGARHITISTCGIIPGIERLMDEDMQITLSVSLHAADDAIRDRIMPVNRIYGLGKVVAAAKKYAEKTGRRVTYEYVMIKDVNDSLVQASKLIRLLKGSLAHVNLIPLNAVPESGLQRSPDIQIAAFRKVLEEADISVTSRREMGSEIEAACGQLRMRHIEGK